MTRSQCLPSAPITGWTASPSSVREVMPVTAVDGFRVSLAAARELQEAVRGSATAW